MELEEIQTEDPQAPDNPDTDSNLNQATSPGN